MNRVPSAGFERSKVRLDVLLARLLFSIVVGLLSASTVALPAAAECKFLDLKPPFDIYEKHKEWLEHGNMDFNDPRYANLCGADMRRTQLMLLDLRYASLVSADLSFAVLDGINLDYAHMDEADMHGAALTAVRLHHAGLVGVDFTDAKLSGSDYFEASMQSAHLDRARVRRADLRNVNLQEASLRDADLFEADLRGARMRDSDLRDANLVGAYLEGAELKEANLLGAKFGSRRSNLRSNLGTIATWVGARGLSDIMIEAEPDTLAAFQELRDDLKKAGMRDEARGINSAILRAKMREGGWLEHFVEFIAFDITSDYGASPGRPLALLLVGVVVFAIPYTFVLLSKDIGKAGAIWRDWPKERATKDVTSDQQERLCGLRVRRAVAVSLYFSALSAFRFDWREWKVKSWISRIQPNEYTLRPTGWVRVMSGVQAILSLYLLALAAVVYFDVGGPFA